MTSENENIFSVFVVNDRGEYERLTHWLSKDRALELKSSNTYFPDHEKIVLMKVED